jgi:hypothetical protein
MSIKTPKQFLLFLAASLFLAYPSWATNTSCSGTYTLDSSTGLPSGSGCEQGDKLFSMFSTYVNNGTPPAPDTISVVFSGTNPAGPITANFTSPGWVNTSNTGSIFLYNDTQVDQVANPGYVLTGFDLDPGSFVFPNTCLNPSSCDSIQIITEFCTNAATSNCSSGDANFGEFVYLAGATSGITDQQYCYGNGAATNACTNGAYTGATAVTFDPSLDITSIFVTNWVIITNYDDNNVTLNGFSNDYYEALASGVPEPGSFFMLGTAIGALALIRRRTAVRLNHRVS